MLKNFCLALLLITCGCSNRQPADTASVATAATTALIPKGAATTVEEDSDSATLNCAALKNFPLHDETLKAFQNLSSATTNQRRGVMVGFGSPGELCTGSLCNTVLTSMNNSDLADWIDAAHLIQGKFSRVTVLGCNVGQGTDGAALVTMLAQETQTLVRAPTSLIWCQDDSLIADPKNQWVTARPGQRAKPNAGPLHSVPVLDTYRLYLDGELREVPSKATRVAQFQYQGFPPYGGGEIKQDEAANLAKLLDLAHPFKQMARPLAALTARIQLSVTVSGEHVIVKHYSLYADAVLQDIDAKDLFYPVDTSLHERLQRLRLHTPEPQHK